MFKLIACEKGNEFFLFSVLGFFVRYKHEKQVWRWRHIFVAEEGKSIEKKYRVQLQTSDGWLKINISKMFGLVRLMNVKRSLK